MNDDATSYDHVLLLDLDPAPDFPHASHEPIARHGIEEAAGGRLKLSRNFRLRPIKLGIYAEPHWYHIIAKFDTRCTLSDRIKATRAVNVHIREARKTLHSMDAIVKSVVEQFPCRVVRGLNYEDHNNPTSKFGTSARRKVNTQFSSSETDANAIQKPQTPPKKKRGRPKKTPADRQNPTQEEGRKRDFSSAFSTPAEPTALSPAEPTALPHDGNPTTPFTVIAPNPNTDKQDDVLDISNWDIVFQDVAPTQHEVQVKEPATKMSRNDRVDLKALHRRLDSFESKVNANLTRIHKALIYLTEQTEKFREDYQAIRDTLRTVTEKHVVKTIDNAHVFPFDSLAALQAYMDSDPDLEILIER